MKKIILLPYFILVCTIAFSQNPLVKMWDKRYGGNNEEIISSLQQTSEGGFIIVGASISGIGGDKTQSTWGYYDYWIVKTDSLGNELWDKDFGGTGDEYFMSLKQTPDGGYILGGTSASGISGNKTQASQGADDYWIVKLDSLGNKQWDKDFGGWSFDEFSFINL